MSNENYEWLRNQVKREDFGKESENEYDTVLRDGRVFKVKKEDSKDLVFTKDVIKYKDEKERELDEKLKVFDKFGLNNDAVNIDDLF